MRIASLIPVLLLATAAPAAIAVPPPPAAFAGRHEPAADDRAAIERLLDAYRAAVKNGDEAGFAALLLNERVPFLAVQAPGLARSDAKAVDAQRYADFRTAVFGSRQRYEQRFDNVRILQDGALAQVSLDFVTVAAGTDDGGYGWKTLELLKVAGGWRIASEFYTAYGLPPAR
jgi:hypothetical protein